MNFKWNKDRLLSFRITPLDHVHLPKVKLHNHFYVISIRVKIIFILFFDLFLCREGFVTDITKKNYEFNFCDQKNEIMTLLQGNTTRPRTSLDVTFAHLRYTVDARRPFFRISIHSRFFCVDRSHVRICKATCFTAELYYSPRFIVFVGLCRAVSAVKIQRCEAPQRAVLADPYRMWSQICIFITSTFTFLRFSICHCDPSRSYAYYNWKIIHL